MSNLLNISGWSGSDQTLLKSILDQVIPASQDGRIPSAGALPRVADYLSAKINNDTALDQLFRRGLTQANNIASAAFDTLDVDAQRAVVEQLEASEPAFFESLLRHIYMAYYSDPDIRSLFGLSASPPHPGGYAVPVEAPEDLATLLAPVKQRGVCFREC